MKAHQNRNMNYDEMHEYGMFNEAAQLARGIVLSLCYHKYNILFSCSYERNISVQTFLTGHLGDASPLPIVGGKPAGPTCQF